MHSPRWLRPVLVHSDGSYREKIDMSSTGLNSKSCV